MFLKNKMLGASLVETIIALGVLSVVVVGTTKFVGDNLSSTQKEKYRGARDQLIYLISESLNNRENIAISAANGSVFNKALANCIQFDGINEGPCQAIGIKNAKSFNLHTVSGDAKSQVIARAPNKGKSLFYNWDLTMSPDPDEAKMNPIVYFWAECGINPVSGKINSSCNKAANIYLSFVVQPVAGPYSVNYAGRKKTPYYFYPYPRGVISVSGKINKRRLYKNATVISANEITSRENSVCPLGRYLKGYDSSGKKICECFTKNCTAKKCKSDQVIVGYEESGQPICRSLTDQSDFECKSKNSANISCPVNHWLISVYADKCEGSAKFEKKGKGGWASKAKWEISCGGNEQFKCCRFKG